jgi:ATP-dependent RNA helicase DeaD
MLRAIERATRQPIEEMQLPSVDAVNDNRVAKFLSRIGDTLAEGNIEFYRELLQRYEGESNTTAIDIAAALAKLLQGDAPFLLTPPARAPRPESASERTPRRNERPERADRGERPARFEPRFERAPRPAAAAEGPREPGAQPHAERQGGDFNYERDVGSFERPRRDKVAPRGEPEFGMETYRIEVGHTHGVKPANIVGAIANEAGLESRFIGRIDIHDDHSILDLPAEMPRELLQHLKKVWVSGQQLQMRRLEAGEEQAPRAAFKPKFPRGDKPAGRPTRFGDKPAAPHRKGPGKPKPPRDP